MNSNWFRRRNNRSTDPQLSELRVPPHSVEAEQSLLGALMLDNQSWDRLGGNLDENDFYRDEHRKIYRQIQNLIGLNKPADVVTVAEALDAMGQSEATGGLAYLGDLAANTPSSAHVQRYAEVVRERSVLRRLVAAADEIASDTINPQGRDAKTLLDEAEKKIFEIAQAGESHTQDFRPIDALLTEVITSIQTLCDRDNPLDVIGLPTGFVDLDRLTSGLQPGDLIIVAGRPSMGKTAFALNIAESVGIHSGLSVGIFSMEMGGAQLAMRMLASVGRVDSQRIRSGRLSDDEWSRLGMSLGKLHTAEIYIDESGGITPFQLRSKARRLARKCGKPLGLIVIDYIQLMNASRQSDNRTTEVSEISRAIKALAKELHVPIIALSQLSRKVEEREDKRPIMSDLRESGAIEQDADVVMFLFREEYYKRNEEQLRGLAECIISKQRNGPTDTIKLTFLKEYTRFESMASNQHYA